MFDTVFCRRELPDLHNNAVILEMSKKYEKTPAQILLRHIVQRGIAAIPKSTNADRIKQVNENILQGS